jgi:hypothetical protein
MDHPLASLAAGSEGSTRDDTGYDEQQVPTPTDGDLMGSGPWADPHTAMSRSFGFHESTEGVPVHDYQTRLSRLLDDDDDVGQEREASQEWADHDRELLELGHTSKSREVDYFDDSERNSPSSWAREEYRDIPVTPVSTSFSTTSSAEWFIDNRSCSLQRQESPSRTPPNIGTPAHTWNRKDLDVESPARSSYRRPSYLRRSSTKRLLRSMPDLAMRSRS